MTSTNERLDDRPPIPRDPADDRLLNALLMLQEHAARDLRPPGAALDLARSAAPARLDGGRQPALRDFDFIADLASLVRAFLDRNPQRAEFTGQLRRALSPVTMGAAFRGAFGHPVAATPFRGKGGPLTKRQAEALRLKAHGADNRQIAEAMGIGEGAARNHVGQAAANLGLPIGAAAGVAASMGYFELDPAQWVRMLCGCAERNYGGVNTLLSVLGNPASEVDRDAAAMGELGALLLVASALVTDRVRIDQELAAKQIRSRLVLLDHNGVFQRIVADGDVLPAQAGALAIVPECARRHGFVPGNMVVALLTPPCNLNECSIVELTPAGKAVRAFCGAPDVLARLVNCTCLGFDADGRLLASTGSMTDAILCFEDGGRAVRRYAEGCLTSFALMPNGDVAGAQYSTLGCRLKVFRQPDGASETVFQTEPFGSCGPIACDLRARLVVLRASRSHPSAASHRQWLESIDPARPNGRRMRLVDLPHPNAGNIAIDANDELYVPLANGDILCLSADGSLRWTRTTKPHIILKGVTPWPGVGLLAWGATPR